MIRHFVFFAFCKLAFAMALQTLLEYSETVLIQTTVRNEGEEYAVEGITWLLAGAIYQDIFPLLSDVYQKLQEVKRALGFQTTRELPERIVHPGIIFNGHLYEYCDEGVKKHIVPEGGPTTSYCSVDELIECCVIGTTNVSSSDFDTWLEEQVETQYHKDNYSSWNNNCNHFAIAVAEFLGVSPPREWKLMCEFCEENKFVCELAHEITRSTEVTQTLNPQEFPILSSVPASQVLPTLLEVSLLLGVFSFLGIYISCKSSKLRQDENADLYSYLLPFLGSHSLSGSSTAALSVSSLFGSSGSSGLSNSLQVYRLLGLTSSSSSRGLLEGFSSSLSGSANSSGVHGLSRSSRSGASSGFSWLSSLSRSSTSSGLSNSSAIGNLLGSSRLRGLSGSSSPSGFYRLSTSSGSSMPQGLSSLSGVSRSSGASRSSGVQGLASLSRTSSSGSASIANLLRSLSSSGSPRF